MKIKLNTMCGCTRDMDVYFTNPKVPLELNIAIKDPDRDVYGKRTFRVSGLIEQVPQYTEVWRR